MKVDAEFWHARDTTIVSTFTPCPHAMSITRRSLQRRFHEVTRQTEGHGSRVGRSDQVVELLM